MYSLNGNEFFARLQFSYNLRKIWCNSKYYNLYQNMTGDYYEQYQTPVPRAPKSPVMFKHRKGDFEHK